METAHEGTSHRGLKDSKAGVGVQELCRKHSISDPTFNKVADEIRGPGRQRCGKNCTHCKKNLRLKQLVAEQALDIQTLKVITTKHW